MLTNPLQYGDTLTLRKEQDCARDVLDALRDAEALQSFLTRLALLRADQASADALRPLMRHLMHVVGNPATSYILLSRIREDLDASDLPAAMERAQQLVQFNEERFQQTLPLHLGLQPC